MFWAGPCYATVNYFWILEDKILKKGGTRFDMVFASSPDLNLPQPQFTEYLHRFDENALISTLDAFNPEHATVDYLQKYDRKFLFFKSEHGGIYPYYYWQGPTTDQPFTFWALPSFAILIAILTIIGVKTIVLFGADGGKTNNDMYYGGWDSSSWGRLMYDTNILNQIWDKALGQVCKLYNQEPPRIINCSPKSHYTCFEKMDYEETLEILRRGEAH